MRQHNYMRALDIQMDTHKWCSEEYGWTYHKYFFMSAMNMVATDEWETAEGVETLTNMADRIPVVLWRADTIFITSDMMHLLMQAGHDLPDEATFDDHVLIAPYGFAYFEEPIYGEDKHGKSISFQAFAWECNPVASSGQMAIIVYFFTDPRDPHDDYNKEALGDMTDVGIPVPPLSLSHYYPAKVGQQVPASSATGSEVIIATLKMFVAMQLLAQQKIGEPMQLRPDRATRKRMARQYQAGDRLITLITLRRRKVKKDDEEPQKVEWSRRWIVRAHWRKQPDKNGWHWRYIYEYVKGPEDKPLVPTERRIFDFRR